MSIKTIFLDRDGVINKEIDYLHKIEDFEFISGIFESCRYLQHLDYQIIIITNQSGIGRGYFTEIDYQKITKWMLNQFNDNDISILDVIHCPHLPNDFCNCRKPKPGMIIKASNESKINLKESYMVGDRKIDIDAGLKAGCKTIFVNNNYYEKRPTKQEKTVKSLHAAVKYILKIKN